MKSRNNRISASVKRLSRFNSNVGTIVDTTGLSTILGCKKRGERVRGGKEGRNSLLFIEWKTLLLGLTKRPKTEGDKSKHKQEKDDSRCENEPGRAWNREGGMDTSWEEEGGGRDKGGERNTTNAANDFRRIDRVLWERSNRRKEEE